MKTKRVGIRGILSILAAALSASWAPVSAAPPAGDLLPQRPSARLQAVTALSGGGALAAPCLTPMAQSIRSDRARATLGARRSIGVLLADAPLSGERRVVDVDGTVLRFTVDRGSFDRVESADENGNGRPDLVDAALSGIAKAHRLLVGQLELPAPGALEIVIARLGSGVDGVSLPSASRGERTLIWLDPAMRGGAAAFRRAAEHQYAHAIASVSGLDASWGEALASWVTLALEGSFDEKTSGSVGRRLGSLAGGLIVDDLDASIGNAAWFAFLDEAYGPTSVKLAIEELSGGDSQQAALDRALQRSAAASMDGALREFQLWSLLVGPRDDRRHFSFASKMPAPSFAATAEALPALSIQGDPEIAPMGCAAVRIDPAESSGGLSVRFEGDLTSRWGADLLLVRGDGTLHRVPVELGADQSGELTVPLQGVREGLLLVRNLDAEGRPARRYSWSARFEPGYPTEVGSLRAESAGDGGGAIVSWETEGERGVFGFNVLRAVAEGADESRVNPVWIPAVGDATAPAAYSFFDAGAAPGIRYRYRVEAVTPEGLASRSEAVSLSPASE